MYAVEGAPFFASSNNLVHQFDHDGDPSEVVIDMPDAHVWDVSSVAPLDAITTKYHTKGKTVTITGMNPDSTARHKRLAGKLKAGH